jgi:hypothetical protein
MALFRRRRASSADTDPETAIAEFWARWPELRERLASGLRSEEGVDEETTRRLDSLLQSMHPALTHELTAEADGERAALAGLDISDFSESVLEDLARLDDLDPPTHSESTGSGHGYTLTVTGGADDTARVTAERWYRAAPDDAEWRFFPARRPTPERLTGLWTVDGHDFDLSHARVELRVDQARLKIDAGVFHPDNMFVSEDTRRALARQVVTLAVGEDDTVRWIGGITPLAEKPLDPVNPAAIPSVVEQLLGALGGVRWVKAQGRVPLAGTFQIGMRYPLHRRDFPAFTLYVLLTVPYAHSGSDRLPAEESLKSLKRFEKTLRDALGTSGAVLAQRTVAGQRQYHIYLEPTAGILPEVEKTAEEWPEGRATVSSFTDPDWVAINELARPLRKKLGSQ